MYFDSPNSLKIGYNPVNRGYFRGFIDEVRVYNRALSADEITELYQMGARKMRLGD
ncbi:MAG: LamG-like jellyroll fold domain-containing protein [Parcubacteria group bacterium]